MGKEIKSEKESLIKKKPTRKKKINCVKKPRPVHHAKGKPRIMTPAIIANPGGQPCKLEQASKIIVAAVRRGNTYENSCMLASICYSTFNNWTRRGKESREQDLVECKYLKFLDALEKAESECENEILQHWKDCIPGNWQAGKEYLARRNSAKWGNQDKLDITSNGEKLGPAFFMPLKDDDE